MDVMSPKIATIAGEAEVDHAIATLVLAFSTDPLARWMYDDPHQYLSHIPRLFRALGTSSFEAGAAQRTTDGLGVTLWLPPVLTVLVGRWRRLSQEAWLARSKPKAPPSSSERNIIGQPSPIGICRSSGSKHCIGTRGVVRHSCSTAFANANREHLLAYLWSSNPLNISHYERHGFKIAGTIRVDSSPSVFPMLRHAH